MFEMKNVSKRFDEEYALRDVSMTINEGLNFIVGSSGSGKTTMLKILSGMEQSFEGEAFFCGKSIKELSEEEKSYFYNNVFGFVWQDFNLQEDLTVFENVMLPQYLKGEQNDKEVMKVLGELKISELASQKAGTLSGGQKQRVAIARELMKNPRVVFADEPTSALDEQSSKMIMRILRDISKSRTVIIVTHNTSFIERKDAIYELDKGELMGVAEVIPDKRRQEERKQPHRLSFRNSCRLAGKNLKSKWSRFIIASLSLLVAATLLLTAVSGAITDSSQSIFNELFATYGQSILDISVVGSFMSAEGTSGNEGDEPSANVSQDIGGLYDDYLKDERVSHILFTQAFDDIEVTLGDKKYPIEASGSVPTVNELTAGAMPMGSGKEVVVPDSFVKKLGISEEEIIGETISFTGGIFNWTSGEPVLMPVSAVATIVGVLDTSVKYDMNGQVMEYSVDDSFFFSKGALDEMRAQAEVEKESANFTIRTKKPSDLIAIKDELNAKGIVPLGRFELVEDMVRLNDQTNQQSGMAHMVIILLSVSVVLAISAMTALSRRKEYAIYKVSGYSGRHLRQMAIAEGLLITSGATVIFLCVSPLLNLATSTVWNVNILNPKMLLTGVILVIGMGMLSGMITAIVSATTKANSSLKTGER